MTTLGQMSDNHSGVEAIEFLVGSRDRGMYRFAWKVWSHKTSFYITAKDGALTTHKFSLHGPDEHHGPEPLFLFREGSPDNPGHTYLEVPDGLMPIRFSGREERNDVLLVARFRFPYYMFDPHVPSARFDWKLSKKRRGALIPPPGFMRAIDVDFYLSRTGAPVVPRAEDAIKNRAVLGPLRNDAGEFLTAEIGNHSLLEPKFQTPESANPAPLPVDKADVSRGLSIMEDDGVIWVVEDKFSESYMLKQLGRTEDLPNG